ncbi:MAG: Flp family type IVb pilin [Anaerolineales bacterium]|nr:Flp family type IVb pilin [Anaerolineales bacterium]
MFILREEKGQGLMEYGLILVLVAIIVVFILGVYGTQIANFFSRVTNEFNNIP